MSTAPRIDLHTDAERVGWVVESARAAGGGCSLTEVAASIAAQPALWAQHVRHGVAERSYVRIFAGEDVEVWVLTWPSGTSTSLHDHGGSAGAFTVIRGCLAEQFPVGPGLHRGLIPTGETRFFDGDHVHDVVNPFGSPAVSVHIYSPPLCAQRYYDFVDGQLIEIATEPADDARRTELPVEVAA